MDKILLPDTDISTTRLGFGCAGLMRVSSRAARQRLLGEAFDAGIRHFDVARMYGLGAAERELGRFARGRRERMVIATKFGIDVNPMGRRLRGIQGLLRPLIQGFPALQGFVGRRSERLYEPRLYDPAKARSSLEASLRELETDYVDLFLVHEPSIEGVRGSDLLEFLESAKADGNIRSFGIAGPVEPILEIRRQAPALAPIIQMPNDAVRRQIEQVEATDQAVITFSPLSYSMTAIRGHFRSDRAASQRWSEAVGFDLTAPNNLPSLLLSYCLRANPAGVVLFSTTRLERLHSAARSLAGDSRVADTSLDAFLDLVRHEIRPSGPSRRGSV